MNGIDGLIDLIVAPTVDSAVVVEGKRGSLCRSTDISHESTIFPSKFAYLFRLSGVLVGIKMPLSELPVAIEAKAPDYP